MSRILIIQTAFPGDAILTLPLIQVLKKQDPHSSIDVIAIPSTASIFSASPYVSEVTVLDKRGKHKSLFSLFKFASEIKKKSYSKIISPHRSLRTSLLVLLSGIKNSFGFDTASFSSIYKHKIKYNPALHEVRRNLSLINFPENMDWKILPEFSFSKEMEEKIIDKVSFGNTKNIAIAPGSVWETKKYPAEYFIEIGKYFVSQNFNIYVIGGNEDFNLCENIKNKIGQNCQNLSGKFSIPESVLFLSKCDLLICNDSAPAHMGTAAGIPVLTIYCSTIPGFGFYPYNSQSAYISFEELECKPCGIHGKKECPIGTFDCAHKINLSGLLSLSQKLLSGLK